MTARLLTSQDITATPAVSLNPGGKAGYTFATVDLDDAGLTYIRLRTPAEAYALRDAFQRAGDLLAEAEGSAP